MGIALLSLRELKLGFRLKPIVTRMTLQVKYFVSDCERLLDEARRYHLLADQRPLLQSPRTQPRKIAKRRRVKVKFTSDR